MENAPCASSLVEGHIVESGYQRLNSADGKSAAFDGPLE